MSASVPLSSMLQAQSPAVTLDFSKADHIEPVTLDFSKAEQVGPNREQVLSRTNQNMALAMSGQQAQMKPEDQEQFESGRKAGTIAGGVQLATSTALGALTAPSMVTKAGPLVPAGRDAAGRFLPWAASQIAEEGPSLARQGVSAATNFVAEHPIAAKALGKVLGGLGIGTALHFLKYIGGAP